MCVFSGKGFPPPFSILFFGEDEEVSPDYFLWLSLAVYVVTCLRVGLGVEGVLTIRAGQP